MFDPWAGKFLWRREWQSTPVFLPGEFHGQRSLAGYSPWGRKELDTTQWLTQSTVHMLPPMGPRHGETLQLSLLNLWAPTRPALSCPCPRVGLEPPPAGCMLFYHRLEPDLCRLQRRIWQYVNEFCF